jgi:hypothetical protein
VKSSLEVRIYIGNQHFRARMRATIEGLADGIAARPAAPSGARAAL